jgi:hypothetical protein
MELADYFWDNRNLAIEKGTFHLFKLHKNINAAINKRIE